jgi:hypothetical protein
MNESATPSLQTELPPAQERPVAMADSAEGEGTLVPRGVALPRVRTALAPEAIVARLDFASRRGRLAGFRPGPGLFSVAAFGQPFDRVLIADARGEEGGTVLEFRSALLLKWPAIFIAVTLFTIWPGVWLTDSLLSTYFASYPWWGLRTWMWYLPLTVLPLPWMAKGMWQKSEGLAHDSAHRAIRKIAAEVDGRIV